MLSRSPAEPRVNLFTLIDLATELLDWEPATVAGQQRMAADLRLLAELQRDTLAAVSDPAATDS